MQTLPTKYRILGNPNSKVIDIQIPTQHGKTCIDAILLALQIVGCQEERLRKLSAGIQAFTPNRANMQRLRCRSPIHSNPKDHLKLSRHSTLADNMTPNNVVPTKRSMERDDMGSSMSGHGNRNSTGGWNFHHNTKLCGEGDMDGPAGREENHTDPQI